MICTPILASNQAQLYENATIYSILTKIVGYVYSVGYISAFKCYFHCILHAECYARHFHLRNKPDCSQNATIYLNLKNTKSYFAIVADISTFKCDFHRILHAE